jgi:CheY-like chemotaxis protein
MNAKILTLLEDPNNLQQVSECLEQSGHCVLKASRYDTAVEILEQEHVDLIVSDVHLQNGGDIFDLLVRLSVGPLFQKVPFVCFSFQPSRLAEYLANDVQTAARLLGAASYISMRTFDAEKFTFQIDQVLSENTNFAYQSGQQPH